VISKKIFLAFLLTVFSMSFVYGEEKKEPESLSDVLSVGKVEIGGYGAIAMRFTGLGKNGGTMSSDSSFSYLIGAKGGITLNKSFTIGAGFYVLTNDIGYRCSEKDDSEYDPCGSSSSYYDVNMSFGYGGLYVSYLFWINNYVGVDLGILIGGGVLKASSNDEYEDRDSVKYGFFAMEPELELVIKITHYLGFGLGVGYRSISMTDTRSDYVWSDLSGFSFNFDIRLGAL